MDFVSDGYTNKGILSVNVGGTLHQVYKETLLRAPFFQEKYNTSYDAKGTLFVDRSPKHFHTILNFMRDGEVPLPDIRCQVEEIKREAEFYGLEMLVETCKQQLEDLAQRSKMIFDDATWYQIWKVNVGGTYFQMYKGTLMQAPFFKEKIVTNTIRNDDTGFFWVDRSPKHFNTILNFMRDGEVPLPDIRCEVEEIKREAEFYGLEKLVELCKKQLEDLTADREAEKMDMKIRMDFYTFQAPPTHTCTRKSKSKSGFRRWLSRVAAAAGFRQKS